MIQNKNVINHYHKSKLKTHTSTHMIKCKLIKVLKKTQIEQIF